MNIKITKEGPWRVGGNLRNFVVGQVLEVGADVPDHIAEDMLRCDYADKLDGMPKIETKQVVEALPVNTVETKAEKKRQKKNKRNRS